jgi:putative hydroxymethylpyrimidine transport system ATP-binding protein
MMPTRPPLSNPAPAVMLSEASFSHGETALFDGISIHLAAGEWSVLLGPSGVGKTTLLRLIAGLEGSATGQVTCDDGLPATGRIAFMAQEDLLLPWLTLMDNVLLGARLRGEANADNASRARTLLTRVGLEAYIDALPATCSGGMRQRAALVRTLMEDRSVVLMDEPFSALDTITRLQLQDIAADLLRDRTVFLITHDPLEALRLGQAIYVMTGRPATIGAPLVPAGVPPRSPNSTGLMAVQTDLLARLTEAAQATAG